MLGLTRPACHHLQGVGGWGGQEQGVGVGTASLKGGLSLFSGFPPLRETSGNISEPLAEAGLEVQVQSPLQPSLEDNRKDILHTNGQRVSRSSAHRERN